MNIRKIQSITTWNPEKGNTTLNNLCLKDFFHYFFDDGGGKVSYTLQSDDLDILSGIIDVPSNVIQQWGASDDVIWNYVASQLNIQLI